MKRWMRYLSLGMLATLAGGASAITVDGQWNDWFSYGGTSSENWSQSSASGSLLNTGIRFQDDSESDASGGQNYDVEQFFFYYEDLDANTYTGGTLFIGMVTGYEPTNSTYRAGDMFIDLGYTGGPASYDLAIATGTESSSRFGDVWSNTGWSTSGVVIPSHNNGSPYRVRNTQPGATYYTNASVDWDYEVGPGSKHNFLEIGLNLTGDMEQLIAEGGIGFHWTMACGNDYIDAFDSNPLSTTPPPTPNTPVPEPATMVLFGMGAGLLAVRKRMSGATK